MRANFEAVKKAVGITHSYQDETIGVWYDEACQFCLEAGVSEEYLESEKATGLIAKGVLDLWDYGSGTGKLSDYFKKRVIQAKRHGEEDEPTEI